MQWYTHDPGVNGNIVETINDERCASRFKGQVMFTLLMDRDGRNLPIAPVLNYSDHKSGKRYLAPRKFMDCLMGFWGIGFLFDQCCNQIYSGSTTNKFMYLLLNGRHFSFK